MHCGKYNKLPCPQISHFWLSLHLKWWRTVDSPSSSTSINRPPPLSTWEMSRDRLALIPSVVGTSSIDHRPCWYVSSALIRQLDSRICRPAKHLTSGYFWRLINHWFHVKCNQFRTTRKLKFCLLISPFP